MTLLILLVILSFSIIHLLEYLSYYARIAGRLAGRPVTGYAVQNATTTITRFFYLALMPLLGFLIDKQIPVSTYQKMGLCALLGATLLSLLAFCIRFHWITLLGNFIQRRSGKPKLRTADVRAQLEIHSVFPRLRIVALAVAVFLCYALGVLVSYYFALVFHDYRSTISQLSGIVNGFATVLLTFVLEPRIAAIVDDHPSHDVYHAVQAMLTGRLVAVGIFAPTLFWSLGNALG